MTYYDSNFYFSILDFVYLCELFDVNLKYSNRFIVLSL